jgi:hypothetical protein
VFICYSEFVVVYTDYLLDQRNNGDYIFVLMVIYLVAELTFLEIGSAGMAASMVSRYL